MKIVLDLKCEPKKNDILIFDGNNWQPVIQDHITGRLDAEIIAIKKDVADFKQSVNIKLKEHHEVLQLLGKGGKK